MFEDYEEKQSVAVEILRSKSPYLSITVKYDAFEDKDFKQFLLLLENEGNKFFIVAIDGVYKQISKSDYFGAETHITASEVISGLKHLKADIDVGVLEI